jgi:hypothetical protein
MSLNRIGAGKGIFQKDRCPPDLLEKVTQTVFEQAEALFEACAVA